MQYNARLYIKGKIFLMEIKQKTKKNKKEVLDLITKFELFTEKPWQILVARAAL